MAAWAATLALTGFGYSAVEKRLTLAARDGTFFWSNGYAWGVYRLAGDALTLSVSRGALTVGRIVLTGRGELALPAAQTVVAGESVTCAVAR